MLQNFILIFIYLRLKFCNKFSIEVSNSKIKSLASIVLCSTKYLQALRHFENEFLEVRIELSWSSENRNILVIIMVELQLYIACSPAPGTAALLEMKIELI